MTAKWKHSKNVANQVFSALIASDYSLTCSKPPFVMSMFSACKWTDPLFSNITCPPWIRSIFKTLVSVSSRMVWP